MAGRPKQTASSTAKESHSLFGDAELQKLDREIWLATRLRQHGVKVFDGVTDPEVRRERFRESILEAGISEVVVGRGKDGKPENYGTLFERLYGQPLALNAKKKRVA